MIFTFKAAILGFVCLIFSGLLSAQSNGEIDNLRSDTLDVINYDISMDFTSMSANTISASCKVSFISKMDNVSGISLDLLSLTVDSVKWDEDLLSYSYDDQLLRVVFDSPISTDEEGAVTVYYHGTPQTDPSGFGGFYFQQGYAYNIGVGMSAEPHNYGRVWHPCFDNFVERATYDLTIIAPAGNIGIGIGYMEQETIGANNENIRKWKMEEEIPTYLACVAVAPFAEVEQMYLSNLDNQPIPILLAAKAQDTTKMKNSFAHLKDAMDVFQSGYGPYRWNKIGYTIVPFNGGAMEHATSITYPSFAINGNLQWETLMAHELSHHWWGNLVTCRTAEDMWINEGLAAYSESLFLEHLYGRESYLENLKKTHRGVIQKAHFNDGGFLSLSGIPHDATYGTHTYDKGATMTHNLRTYMGDSTFFQGLKAIQDQYEFKDIDAAEFRDVLTSSTDFDANEFFEDYIFNPGFSGFEIDSFSITSQGNEYEVTIHVQQKLFEAPAFFENVPLQFTFVGSDWSSYSTNETVSEEYSTISINVPFEPTVVYLNKDSGLLNAVTGEDLIVNASGINQIDYAYFYLKVEEEEDSSFLRVEHYRLPADGFIDAEMSNYLVVSPDRYWKVDGILSESFEASGRLAYNAKNTAGGNLDNGLMIDHDGIAFHEDSLVLLWRSHQGVDWVEYPFYELQTQANKLDGTGFINLTKVIKGEYAFGFRKLPLPLGINSNDLGMKVKIFPNPTKNKLNIELNENSKFDKWEIVDTFGRKVDSNHINQANFTISTKQLAKGTYVLLLKNRNQVIGQYKFVKE